MSEAELKRCPICGEAEGVLVEVAMIFPGDSKDDIAFQDRVECQNCGALGPPADTRAYAIKTWNERKETPVIKNSVISKGFVEKWCQDVCFDSDEQFVEKTITMLRELGHEMEEEKEA